MRDLKGTLLVAVVNGGGAVLGRMLLSRAPVSARIELELTSRTCMCGRLSAPSLSEPESHDGGRPSVVKLLKNEKFVRNDGIRQITQEEPPQVGGLRGFEQTRFAVPPPALKEEIDPLIDRIVFGIRTMHATKRPEISGLNRDPELFEGLAACRVQHRLPGLNMAGGSDGPVSVHVAGALAQVKQNLLTMVPTPARDDVGGRDQPKGRWHESEL